MITMENKRQIVIPDVECMTEEQYKELTDFLDSCPIGYEVWGIEK